MDETLLFVVWVLQYVSLPLACFRSRRLRGRHHAWCMCSSPSRTINIRASCRSPRFSVTAKIRRITFGVKTYCKNNAEWELLRCDYATKMEVLERCIFKSRSGGDVYLVAYAYDGSQIKKCVTDFLSAAAAAAPENISISTKSLEISIDAGGAADLLVYVGHEALMDFQIPTIAGRKADKPRRTIILACASKSYFAPYLRLTGAEPLLWTTGLMAAEAYTLQAALAGWIAAESDEAIRGRAASAYDTYQKCGSRAASRLFATGR